MKKRLLSLILFLAALILLRHSALPAAPSPVPVPPTEQTEQKIVLVPLDGRPPCRQFVIDAGHIGAFDVQVPPSSLQDYYSLPGDTEGMKAWVKESAPGSHALILSIDQLLYGGLLAAREREAPQEAMDSLITFLRELHRANPGLPIYAFSILPRLSPQDTIDGYEERRDLMKYSRLVGKRAAGLPVDETEIRRLEEKIPPKSMETYRSHFEENKLLNQRLAELAAEGTLTRLVLGQDDGEKFGIPNIEKEELLSYLRQRGISEEKVFLTHGADEIALTLLAEIKCKDTGYRPKIFVEYNSPKTADTIMPYMAVSIRDSAEEKLRMLHAHSSGSREDADAALFLSANDREEDTLGSRLPSARKLKQLAETGHRVAIVDLSRHFSAEETLFPLLLQENAPLNSFLAYAGWNTTSNAIGTALAQSLLFLAREKEIKNKGEALALCRRSLTFLHNRYLEDFYYLKDVIDKVNIRLKRAGYRNTADLDLEHNFQWANAMLRDAMRDYAAVYQKKPSVSAPFRVETPEGPVLLRLKELRVSAGYPWPRTFEIDLRSTLYLEELSPVPTAAYLCSCLWPLQ